MMKTLIFVLSLSGFALSGLALTGCATKDVPTQLATEMADSYVTPTDYVHHRAQQQLFDTGLGKIAFTDHGPQDANAPTIVLLHGVPTSSWMYRKLVPSLQQNMRVITVDHLGYGSSEKPKRDEADYGPAAQARRVDALLASRGVSHYSVLMHDMGGLVAWEMLAKNPDVIDNLVVLNTIVDDHGFEQPEFDAGVFAKKLFQAYTSSLTSEVILDRTFSDLGLKGKHKLTEEECYGYVRPMREGADHALYSFFTNIDDDLFADLKRKQSAWPDYKGKVMVMWGAQDEILTTEQIPVLKTAFNIPDEDIHIYEDNAHFLAEEIPDEIVAKISAFVR